MSRCLRCGADSEWIQGETKKTACDDCTEIIDLNAEIERLKKENKILREKLESHAPEGHNCTNEQFVNLRDENERLRQEIITAEERV